MDGDRQADNMAMRMCFPMNPFAFGSSVGFSTGSFATESAAAPIDLALDLPRIRIC